MPGNVWKWPPSCMLCSFSRENLLTLGKSMPGKTIQRNCRLCFGTRLIAWFHPDFLSTCKWVPVSTWQLSFGFPPHCVSAPCSPLWLCHSRGWMFMVWWISSYLQDISDWLVVSAGLLLWGRILMPLSWISGKEAVVDLWCLPQAEDWTVEGYMLSICILPMHFRYDRKIYGLLASLWVSPIAIVQCRDWGGLRLRYYTRLFLSIKWGVNP